MKAKIPIQFTLIILLVVSALQAQEPDKGAQMIYKKSLQVLGDTRVFGIAIEDVDMDGDNDVFMTNFVGPSKLWLNNGKGNFIESNQDFGNSEAHAVAIADFNVDGLPDIFLLNHAAPCKVYFNDGRGTFKDSGQNIGSLEEFPGMIVCGDVDSDGDLDAFISYYQLPNRLWINNGKGFFSITNTGYGGDNGHSMVLADVNGDGFSDLFLCISDQPDEIWLNDGKGNFTDSGQRLGNVTGYESVDAGDVNGDKYVDFVTGNNVDGIKIWLNQNGTGKFIEAGPYLEPGTGICKLLDADLDGDLDLFLSGKAGIKLMMNNGKGIYSSGQVFDETWVARVAFGKLDNDNDFDIVLGKREGTGGNPIYFNESTGLSQTASQSLMGPYLGQIPPGNKSTLFAPGFVSTMAGELNSVFTSDGKEFYFTRRGIPGKPSVIMVTRIINNVWTKPAPVNFSGRYNDVDLYITPDGRSMIYCSGRIVNEGDKARMNNDFWITHRSGYLWGEPARFAEEAVSEFEDYYPIVTMSGNLYFNSQRGGPGTNDIYCSKYVDGKYTTSEKLPEPVNTSYREFDAFVSQDEEMIIFSSERPGGFGGSDIYISFKKPDKSWSEPVNPGNDINSPASEYGATISPDGKYLFYTSGRNGSEDIFWVSAGFINKLKIK